MFRVHCPFCDRIHDLDLFFKDKEFESIVCKECFKTFYVYKDRSAIPNEVKASSVVLEGQVDESLPYFSVVENNFAEAQKFALPSEGTCIVGRRNKDSAADIQIYTSDPSLDRQHFILGVSGKGNNKYHYVQDYDSNTGTFVNNQLLRKSERKRLVNGDVLSVGATSVIVTIPGEEEDWNLDLSEFDILE